MKTFALAAVSMIALGSGVQARAESPGQHVDDVAYTLMRQSGRLVRELRYAYRRHPEHRHLYEDAVEMCRLAEHVHDLAHDRRHVRTIQRDVDQLDELFHHVEDVLDSVNTTGGCRYRCGYHERKANALVAAIEETLHHLKDDVDELADGPVHRPTRVVPRSSRRVYPRRGRPRVTFGGSSHGVRIGFSF